MARRGILAGTLEAVLERAEVGEDEVVLVARQRRGRVLAAEGRDHEQQCVHLAQFAHGSRRAASAGMDVDHLDLDGDPLAGVLHLDKDVEPGLGDVDHRDLALGLTAGDGAPQGGLAAAGGSGDAD